MEMGIVIQDFNTSHVTVYPVDCAFICAFTPYFNTSHVTVYRTPKKILGMIHWFQYISCYCLSQSIQWKRLTSSNFNTSHVTVYREEIANAFYVNPEFQYISCYCLSTTIKIWLPILGISIHLMLLFIIYNHTKFIVFYWFQYISCYCLSLPSFAM